MTEENIDYNATAKFFHWFLVGLIAIQFPLGWLMQPTGRDELPTASVNLHFSIGMVVLIGWLGRLVWKLRHPVGMEPSLPQWQKTVAHSAHWLIYAVSFATLMTGWAHASVRGWPIKLFGLIPIPAICPLDSEFPHWLGNYHKGLGLALLALIFIHIGGVLFHEFVQGDRLMVRILPRGASEWRLRPLWSKRTPDKLNA